MSLDKPNYLQITTRLDKIQTTFKPNELQTIFNSIDTDNNGYIDDKELLIWMKSQGIDDINEKEIVDIFKRVDIDQNQEINFSEFRKMMELDDVGFERYYCEDIHGENGEEMVEDTPKKDGFFAKTYKSINRKSRGAHLDPSPRKSRTKSKSRSRSRSRSGSRSPSVSIIEQLPPSQIEKHLKTLSNNEIQEKFNFFDKNGDGFITSKELQRAMKKLGQKMDKKEISGMMERLDENNDGKISFDEFCKLFE